MDVLLSGAPSVAGSVADFGLDSSLWDATLKSLEEDEPSIAASTVCQLALIFASKKQPYHYERGFSLCLWPMQPGVAAELPREMSESPEVLFARLVKAHPKLHGQFPLEFSGNWSTGTFIPAKKIKKALIWIRKQVDRFDEGDRDEFRGLLLLLEHCAKHKLAYWEGTDLPVPMATMSVEGNEARRAARCFRWPDYGYEPLTQSDTMFVCKYLLGPSKDSRTALADFSDWPPRIDWLPEYATEAAISNAGKLITVAAEPGECFYTPRLRTKASSHSAPIQLSAAKDVHVGENGYEWAGVFGQQVIALVSFKKDKTGERHPLINNQSQLEQRGFRATKDDHSDHWGGEKIKVGVAATSTGANVFIWGDEGFEIVDGKFQKTFSLAPGPMWRWSRSTVPAGTDGFYYPSDSRLFEAQPGQEPVQHLPRLSNIMAVRQGPENSLLITEGNNKAGD